MPKAKSEYLEYIAEQLEGMGELSSRAMFGGYCLYQDKIPFAIIADDQLYFKVGVSNQSDYEAAGSKPFTYAGKKGKPVSLSYWEVPSEVLEDVDTLLEWARKAYDVALAVKRK